MNLDDSRDPWHLGSDGVIRDQNGLAVLAEELERGERVEYREYENRYVCGCGANWAVCWHGARDSHCAQCGACCSPVSSQVVDIFFFEAGEPCPACGIALGKGQRKGFDHRYGDGGFGLGGRK